MNKIDLSFVLIPVMQIFGGFASFLMPLSPRPKRETERVRGRERERGREGGRYRDKHRGVYRKRDFRSCVISFAVSCHIVAHA